MSESPSATAAKIERPSGDQDTRRAMKPVIKEAHEKSFSDRTNIKSAWVGEHSIVSSTSGDMAL